MIKVAAIIISLALLHGDENANSHIIDTIKIAPELESSIRELYNIQFHNTGYSINELRIPTSIISSRNHERIIISRAYYISPHELAGFELSIPVSAIKDIDDSHLGASDITIGNITTRQGMRIITFNKHSAQQADAPEPLTRPGDP